MLLRIDQRNSRGYQDYFKIKFKIIFKYNICESIRISKFFVYWNFWNWLRHDDRRGYFRLIGKNEDDHPIYQKISQNGEFEEKFLIRAYDSYWGHTNDKPGSGKGSARLKILINFN